MTASSRPAWTGYAAALGVVLIWTGFILISRWGGKSALTGYDVLALRLGTAAVLLLPFCRDLPWSVWRDRRLWTLAGLGGVLYGVLVYTAFKFAPAAHGGILLPGMQPFLVTALLWGWLGERPIPVPAPADRFAEPMRSPRVGAGDEEGVGVAAGGAGGCMGHGKRTFFHTGDGERSGGEHAHGQLLGRHQDPGQGIGQNQQGTAGQDGRRQEQAGVHRALELQPEEQPAGRRLPVGQGAEVVEVAMGAGRVLPIRNAEAEIRLVPAEHDQ